MDDIGEKRIPYKIEKINMRCYSETPREFSRLQPSGAIPVAIIDGKVYNQSNDIIYALEFTSALGSEGETSTFTPGTVSQSMLLQTPFLMRPTTIAGSKYSARQM